MINIPETLAVATIAREGDAGRSWIDELPVLVQRYLTRWACAPSGPPTHGGVGMIIPVESPYGPAMIKISFRHPGNVDEPAALQAWQGNGAVRLYEHEPADLAMLIERVEQRSLDLSADEGLIVGAELSARLAIRAPARVPSLANDCPGWAEQLRDQDQQLGHPLPDRVIDGALEVIDDLGRDRTETMIHGDLHGQNILHADRGWVVVDPKGRSGTGGFDAMTMCLYRHEELLGAPDPVAELRRRITIFAEAAGVDTALAIRCTQARLTSSALWDLLHANTPIQQQWARIAADAAQSLL
ncbi:kinase [Microlunatus elymi]|uniref:Kinase n=1 Tax=Microlunatus elymi TaxID=2596828 RepID=A0A516Q3X6_9ACTN|nr:aminoglycoside phosphotransferase family protein [Microlunatus elymi]QDP98072.1 kinase [Microlunatus elymi]